MFDEQDKPLTDEEFERIFGFPRPNAAPKASAVQPTTAAPEVPSPGRRSKSAAHSFVAMAPRIIGGVASSIVGAVPSLVTTPAAAAIGGLGEYAGQWIESDDDFDHETAALEAGLSAIPLGKVFKVGKGLANTTKNMIRGAGLMEVGNMSRRVANEGSILNGQDWIDHAMPNSLGEAGWDAATMGLGALGGRYVPENQNALSETFDRSAREYLFPDNQVNKYVNDVTAKPGQAKSVRSRINVDSVKRELPEADVPLDTKNPLNMIGAPGKVSADGKSMTAPRVPDIVTPNSPKFDPEISRTYDPDGNLIVQAVDDPTLDRTVSRIVGDGIDRTLPEPAISPALRDAYAAIDIDHKAALRRINPELAKTDPKYAQQVAELESKRLAKMAKAERDVAAQKNKNLEELRKNEQRADLEYTSDMRGKNLHTSYAKSENAREAILKRQAAEAKRAAAEQAEIQKEIDATNRIREERGDLEELGRSITETVKAETGDGSETLRITYGKKPEEKPKGGEDIGGGSGVKTDEDFDKKPKGPAGPAANVDPNQAAQEIFIRVGKKSGKERAQEALGRSGKSGVVEPLGRGQWRIKYDEANTGGNLVKPKPAAPIAPVNAVTKEDLPNLTNLTRQSATEALDDPDEVAELARGGAVIEQAPRAAAPIAPVGPKDPEAMAKAAAEAKARVDGVPAAQKAEANKVAGIPPVTGKTLQTMTNDELYSEFRRAKAAKAPEADDFLDQIVIRRSKGEWDDAVEDRFNQRLNGEGPDAPPPAAPVPAKPKGPAPKGGGGQAAPTVDVARMAETEPGKLLNLALDSKDEAVRNAARAEVAKRWADKPMANSAFAEGVAKIIGGKVYTLKSSNQNKITRYMASVNPPEVPPTGSLGKGAAPAGKAPAKAAAPIAPKGTPKASTDTDYRGSHKAPSDINGSPAHDLTKTYPDDVYSADGPRIYGARRPDDAEAFNIINKIRGNPEATVTVYRAVPKGAQSAINEGDWVSISRQYAADHGERFGEYDVISKQVKAKDIYTSGDGIHEWGYNPKRTTDTVGQKMGAAPAKTGKKLKPRDLTEKDTSGMSENEVKAYYKARAPYDDAKGLAQRLAKQPALSARAEEVAAKFASGEINDKAVKAELDSIRQSFREAGEDADKAKFRQAVGGARVTEGIREGEKYTPEGGYFSGSNRGGEQRTFETAEQAAKDAADSSKLSHSKTATRKVLSLKDEPPAPPAAPVKAEAPKPQGWLGKLDETKRESVYAEMRKLEQESMDGSRRASEMAPRNGEIAVGAGDYDIFIKAEAQREFLHALRKGDTVEDAVAAAKKAVRESVAKHNAKRPKDVNWKRADMMQDANLDDLGRRFNRIVKGEAPKTDTPLRMTGQYVEIDGQPFKFLGENHTLTKVEVINPLTKERKVLDGAAYDDLLSKSPYVGDNPKELPKVAPKAAAPIAPKGTPKVEAPKAEAPKAEGVTIKVETVNNPQFIKPLKRFDVYEDGEFKRRLPSKKEADDYVKQLEERRAKAAAVREADAKATEAPKAEAPKTEAPKADVPKVTSNVEELEKTFPKGSRVSLGGQEGTVLTHGPFGVRVKFDAGTNMAHKQGANGFYDADPKWLTKVEPPAVNKIKVMSKEDAKAKMAAAEAPKAPEKPQALGNTRDIAYKGYMIRKDTKGETFIEATQKDGQKTLIGYAGNLEDAKRTIDELTGGSAPKPAIPAAAPKDPAKTFAEVDKARRKELAKSAASPEVKAAAQMELDAAQYYGHVKDQVREGKATQEQLRQAGQDLGHTRTHLQAVLGQADADTLPEYLKARLTIPKTPAVAKAETEVKRGRGRPSRPIEELKAEIDQLEAKPDRTPGDNARLYSLKLQHTKKVDIAKKAPAEQVKSIDKTVEDIKKSGKLNDAGFIANQLAMHLGGFAAGAMYGATKTPDDPLAGALMYGLAGASTPAVFRVVRNHINSSQGLDPRITEGSKEALAEWTMEKVTNFAKGMPDFFRFSYLANPVNLPINAVVGPFGSAAMMAIEMTLAGHVEGRELFKALLKGGFRKNMVSREIREEAREAILHSTDRSEISGEVGPELYRKLIKTPALAMTTGDISALRLATEAGIPEDLARSFLLTSEPVSGIGASAGNARKARGRLNDKRSWLVQMMLPFYRTNVNQLEQGAMRFPVFGPVIRKAWGDSPVGFQRAIVQQAMSLGTAGGGYMMGALVPKEDEKVALKFINNFGGVYGSYASAGFLMGVAKKRGKDDAEAVASALKQFATRDMPIPSAEIIFDSIKMLEAYDKKGVAGLMENLPYGVVPPVLSSKNPVGIPSLLHNDAAIAKHITKSAKDMVTKPGLDTFFSMGSPHVPVTKKEYSLAAPFMGAKWEKEKRTSALQDKLKLLKEQRSKMRREYNANRRRTE